MFRIWKTCVRRAWLATTVMALSALTPWTASAQVVDATTAEFEPSVDHATVLDGIAVVTSYSLHIFANGSTTPSQTLNLGKPAPGSDGLIRVAFTSLLSSPLAAGVNYQASVGAIGPGGSAFSTLSNVFTVSPPVTCAPPVLSATSASVAASGATGSVGVSAAAGCTWTASSAASWLTVTSGASGNGPGTVGYAAAANTSTSARTGTLTIAGQTFSVTQGAAPCSYSLSPTSAAVAAGGGTASATVTTSSNCAWTASTAVSWLTITSGASRTGTGSVSISAAANTATSSRSGTLTLGDDVFTVTQSGATPCSYSLSSSSASIAASGGTATTTVTSGSSCAWSATSNASWIAVSAGTSGSGNGSVSMTIAANTTTTQRTGTVLIGDDLFTVTEAGAAPCSYTLSSSSASIAAVGGTAATTVTTGSSCAWSATSNAPWLVVSAGASGSGNGSVSMTVASNTTTAQRTGIVTIGSSAFTVTQSAASCSYAVTPGTVTVGPTGASGSVTVTTTAGCTWAASGMPNWISIATGSRSGTGSFSYTVARNNAGSRIATVTVGTGSVIFTQQSGLPVSAPGNLRVVGSGAPEP